MILNFEVPLSFFFMSSGLVRLLMRKTCWKIAGLTGVLSCLVNLWNLTCYLAFHNKTMKLGLQCQWWTKLHAEMCTAYHNCMKQEINEMVKLTKWSMSFLLEEQEKVTKSHLSFDDTNCSRHSWQSSRHCESCKRTIQIHAVHYSNTAIRLLRFI